MQQLLGPPIVTWQVRGLERRVNAFPDAQRLVDVGRHLGVERQGDRDHGPEIAQQIGLMREDRLAGALQVVVDASPREQPENVVVTAIFPAAILVDGTVGNRPDIRD
ncbi:MAG: hypothetical protein AW10_01833 [Candidatus Accumulibacter appositus]|uniref:Uncharacterized protein n=1 Tax=Candidatus Accumulibacter appositus TaxID=1454003 RepID=A0A011PU97_9PROT|nr:MAG: hypothetical protein AW10_01833 [Candidatus Accumulibacter appositus]